jgi:NAD(P)H dehydrogenase (quinone)
MTLIATTGSTGRLGGRVARRLASAGATQRLIVRDPARAPELERAEAVTAAYGDAAAIRQALEGADVALLVYISFYGASPSATFTLARDHWVTEEYIKASSLAFTFLRDTLYADFLPLMVGEDGVIRGPAGDGRVAAVVQDDIADVAATILQAPGPHGGATYDLTGPEPLSFAEIATVISAAWGREVTYHAESLEEAYA